MRVAQVRPYWGTLPSSPVKSPPKQGARDTQQRLEESQDIPARQQSIKRRPEPIVPGSARYSVFPRPPSVDSQLMPAGLVHSESARRSLSQQRRLSYLVPSEAKPIAHEPSTAEQERCSSPLAPTSGEDPPYQTEVTPCPSAPRLRTTTLSKFTRELEEFAKSAGVSGRLRDPAPPVVEAHASVRTVQELLPYRQQFQEAGLAVTSTDQRPPKAGGFGSHSGASGDERLRFDGSASATKGLSASSNESSNDTVIHHRQYGPMSLVLTGQLRQDKLGQKSDKQCDEKNLPPKPLEQKLQSFVAPEEPESSAAAEKRGAKPRPSAMLLVNKPLPDKPGPSTPVGSKKPPAGYPRPSQISEGLGLREGQIKNAQKSFEQVVRTASPPEIAAPSVSTSAQTQQMFQPDMIDKSLPSLPLSRVPSQLHHLVALSGKTGWAPSVRELPTTIVEEKEPSPEKQMTPIRRSLPSGNKHSVNKETQHKENRSNWITANGSKLSFSSKPELPETWKHAISTPSSFEKALDDVVRKLEAMEEKKPSAESEKVHRRSKRTSSKPPSPSQRLQRAAAMRRQRLAENTPQKIFEPGDKKKPPVVASTPVVPPRRPSARLVVLESSSQRTSSKFTSGEGSTAPAQDDRGIADKDVLKGLKIICAASADPDLDNWIRCKTGLRLRRFLADLKTFDTLSEEGKSAVDEQRARRRRAERRRLQAERGAAREVVAQRSMRIQALPPPGPAG
ncbi:hypothetical protein B0T24DRAFT_45446 [Lasiosphaeria ovina]|uniref:Uncharacterized protein n=1 Tax=Lasiosphaeria ovina TaxID=92902 RepID=A0AAE0NKY9_9PEZI|nr:hypothetical protein B0T24DRAFT_45446 [Lasiosphaeria ovina]